MSCGMANLAWRVTQHCMQSRSAGRPLHELSNMKLSVCTLLLQQEEEIFVQLQSDISLMKTVSTKRENYCTEKIDE
jgi:hypothetical protein